MGRFLFLAGLALALISCSDSGSSAPETPAADAVPAEVDARALHDRIITFDADGEARRGGLRRGHGCSRPPNGGF